MSPETEKSRIIYSKEENIVTVVLNAPPVNSLSHEIIDELEKILPELSDPSIKAVILTGQGKCFSAGANIKGFPDHTVEENQAYFERIYNILKMVESIPVPVIAAINGYAMGAGLELSLCADIRVMDANSRLGATSVNLGLIFCTQRLPRLIGISRAKDLLLTARHIDAREALDIGLVQYISPAGKSMDKARELADLIASKSPLALKGVKDSVHRGYEQPLPEGLKLEYHHLSAMFATEDFQQRVNDFLDMRSKNQN